MEIWRTVVVDGIEHPRYQVSNLGRVKSLSWGKTKKERICKLTVSKYGYYEMRIDSKTKKVHRIVAEAFLPNPENKPYIDHIDCNTINNIVEVDEFGNPIKNSKITNLRWCTQKENCNNPLTIKHYRENNNMLGKFGKKHHNSIKIIQLTKDLDIVKIWDSLTDVERELKIPHQNISKCCRGKYKTCGGYRWMYHSNWLKVFKRKPEDIKPLF